MPPVKKNRKKISKPRPRSRPRLARKAVRRTARKAVAARKVKSARARKPAVKAASRVEGKVIGKVTHYFPKVRAAVVDLKAPLSVGDRIKIKGHTTEFVQNVVSMQIDRVPLKQAKKGDVIGLLVNSRVRSHDLVTKA